MFIAGDDELNAANMYAYCNGNPVMYCDPTGMVSDMAMFGEALNIALLAFFVYGLGDTIRALVVMDAARNATTDKEMEYEFLRAFRQGIRNMIDSNGATFYYDTPFLTTNKDVCTAMANYISPHFEMSNTAIRNEIYFHGMLAYSYNNTLDFMRNNGITIGGKDADDLRESAIFTQLDTGGDSRILVKVGAPIVWLLSIGMR
jgi:hypothetical protein